MSDTNFRPGDRVRVEGHDGDWTVLAADPESGMSALTPVIINVIVVPTAKLTPAPPPGSRGHIQTGPVKP